MQILPGSFVVSNDGVVGFGFTTGRPLVPCFKDLDIYSVRCRVYNLDRLCAVCNRGVP